MLQIYTKIERTQAILQLFISIWDADMYQYWFSGHSTVEWNLVVINMAVY